MESGPAAFAAVALAVFGAGLLAWTVARVLRRVPVALDVNPVASAVVAGLVATAALAGSIWCFGQI